MGADDKIVVVASGPRSEAVVDERGAVVGLREIKQTATGAPEPKASAGQDASAGEAKEKAATEGADKAAGAPAGAGGAPGDDGDDDAEEAESQEGKPAADGHKRPRGFKLKLERAREELELTVRERELARQEAADLKARLARLEQEHQAPPRGAPSPASGPEKPASSKRPEITDFETVEAFDDAMDKYTRDLAKSAVEEALSVRDRRERERQAKADEAKARESVAAMLDKARAAHKDFDDVVLEAHKYLERRGLELTADVERIILGAGDAGGEFLYAMANNPQELARICRDPVAAARELGKVEGALTRAPRESAGTRSNANKLPEPIRPVTSHGSGAAGFDPNNCTQAEYEAARRAGWNGK